MDSNVMETDLANKLNASSGPSKSTGGGDQTTESEPSLSLPKIAASKGGGALRGIDEKFTTNPVNGTASLAVPVNISASRSGFQPTVSLTYGSGDGNGSFGLGWSLTTPSVTRKTDKGLPQYLDFSDSDCFILSGAEDLVPRFKTDENGTVLVNASGQASIEETTRNGFIVRRYVPRVESAFARVERWTRYSDGDVHWRTITGANVTTVFGIDASSRVADIETGNVFSWLCSHSYDDKGNAMLYSYKSESSENVDANAANELNRHPEGRSVNRYIKSIKYGNRKPNRDVSWNAFDPRSLDPDRDWMFEVIFDYGEHSSEHPTVKEEQPWPARMDPFSSCRSAFEVRTYRLCRRILMFHHFPDELGVQDYLVRSLDISYQETPTASYTTSFLSCGYQLSTPDPSGKRTYSKSSVPPLDLEYILVPEMAQLAATKLKDLDKDSLENLPVGVDGSSSQWVDLDGEGLPGVLTVESASWYYKRNTSANNIPDSTHPEDVIARLSTHEEVRQIPDVSSMSSSVQFLDLASDGQLDVVLMSGGISGFWERDSDGTWDTFRDFRSFPNVASNDPNWRFVDITGDGLADILISEQDAFTWYPSKAEDGFGNPERVSQALDEEKGPRLVFSEAMQSIFLADMTGDGLVDLVRIRNSDICYWPNLGYGRFGARVMMDNAPCFETFNEYNPKKVHLADVDGSGTSDVIYFGSSGVDIYLNQAGNGFSEAVRLDSLDPVSMEYNAVAVVDLLGGGTSCVVISSKLPGDGGHCIRYLDLMGGQKPHLLTKIVNNMGAETQVQYSPSTRFYLDDKDAGHPWVTRLHFPVHCVARVDTLDMISQCRFTTRYAYHHGYYDGVEREFRGFAMVETWDSQVIDQLVDEQAAPVNMDKSSSIPPVRTKTWFHTGAYQDASTISTHLRAEYFQSDDVALLPDSTLKNLSQLSGEEAREAIRALKGSTLRSETYSEDGTNLASIPYLVKEQNYTVSTLQPRQSNAFAVFHSQSSEDLTYHLERKPDDGRMQHTIVLEADRFGNILKSIQIAYGRRPGKSTLQQAGDIQKQEQTYITYAETDVTDMITTDEEYRLPATCETRSWEITGLGPTSPMQLWSPSVFIDGDFSVLNGLTEIPFEELSDPTKMQKRMLKCKRIFYRKNDLSGDLLLGKQETFGLMAATYSLAFTPGLLSGVYQKTDSTGAVKPLLQNATDILGSIGKGAYVDLDKDGRWWVPSGRAYFHIDGNATAAQEITEARNNFFLLRRRIDQFGNQNVISYDPSRLLGQISEDALGNTLTAVNDYRVLQATMVTDANGNRVQNGFDTLGIVCASALRGKATENLGDNVDGFDTEVTQADIEAFFQDPKGPLTRKLLGTATSRQIYDTNRYWRTKSSAAPEAVFSASISRETHSSDPGGDTTKLQIFFSYFDGFGREIQKKMEAEAGPIDDSNTVVSPTRWSTPGWTIFDNKSNPVKKFEPYFTPGHHFSPGREVGVASIMFYDPLSRPVATLHPNHTWEKTVRGVWDEVAWDMNDTCNIPDPRKDPDVGNFFARLPDSSAFMPSWVDARKTGALGDDEKTAALQALNHANTPAISHLDSLGRVILTIADNGSRGKYENRVVVDIEGKPLSRIDAKGRTYTRSRYNVLGSAIYEAGMESGAGWTLHDCAGRNMLSWNSRNFSFRYEYDVLGRPSRSFVTDGNGPETAFNQKIYGESVQEAEKQNLRARIYQSLDQAGIATTLAYDFKGNTLESQRQLWQEYKKTVDLASPPALEEALYKSSTQFDALNRAFQVVTPENSTVMHTYNEASLLETVTAKLHPRNGQADGVWETFVSNIDYNAKGQRVSLTHGNGTVSTYTYDPITYRITRMRLTKGSTVLQDLNYTSDPVGNVITVRDKAQQTVYFRNTVVDAATKYTYDALYRLVSANGREHLGQSNGAPGSPTPPDASDSFQTRTVSPGDGNAMGLYTEIYDYDEVGNILSLRHDAGSAGSWTRTYGYNESSALEPAKKSNRLSTTTIGKAQETYGYDEHGNMTKMPHLSLMQWNFQDRLQATSKQNVNDGTPETTYYIYDNSGQRVRKVSEQSAVAGQEPKRMSERVYIGSFFEVYREFPGSPPSASPDAPSLERETLHIFDDKDRVCAIETRTIGTDKAPEIQRRYSHGNHIGSVALELSDNAGVISYEEYFPYGGTSYQAMASQTDLPKRYRYTGKERDEENGFYYNGARYYASWLGRWTACDPGAYGDGPNLYQYVRSNPISMADPNGADAMLPSFMQEYGKHIIDTVHSKVNNYLGHVQTDSKVGQALLGVAQAGVDLAAGVAVMEVAPEVAGQEMAKNMVKTYNDNGGGFKGAFIAANQLNPAFHMIENGADAIDAYKAGNVREAFRKGTHATIDAVGTVAIAEGGAGLLEGMTEGVGAGIEGGVEAGGEGMVESTPTASEPPPTPAAAADPVPAEAPPPPPAEPVPASAPPPPPAPPAAPACPTCGKLRSDYGPGPVTRADGTQTLPAGTFDLNQPFSKWHPSDLDAYKPSISTVPIQKGSVAPPLGKGRGVGKPDYRERDVILDDIEANGGHGYPQGTRPQVQIGHEDGSLWSKPPGAPVRKGLSPTEFNNAKSPWEKIQKARAKGRGDFVR